MNNKYLHEESYFTDISYDTFDDYICYNTRYRFKEKYLVTEFVKYIEEKYTNTALCYDIFFEKRRSIISEIYRPVFSDIKDAIEDLNNFIMYCNNIHYNYKYKDDIFQIERDEHDYIILKKEYERLKEENKLLKKENGILKEENGILKEENGILKEENGILKEENKNSSIL